MRVITSMMQRKLYGMRHSDLPRTQDCVSCTVAKYKRALCVRNLITKGKARTVLADICGPVRTTSCGGSRYFLEMMTGEERYIRVHILENRNNLKGYFHSYVQCVERQTNKKLGRIHTDNAPEFLPIRREFERIGITLTTFSAYTPQENALAEGINGILLVKGLSMIEHCGLKLKF